MKPNAALNDAEIDQLNDWLCQGKDATIPNIEALDGFFAALACCPDLVKPSEFLSIINDGMVNFPDMDAFQAFLDLMMRHYNSVNATLRKEEIYWPLLLEDEDGVAHGNDWAKGFLTGTHLRPDIWGEFMDDEDHAGPLIPIMILAHEHSPDPEMRPFDEPMTDEKRQDLFAIMAAGVMMMYRHFLPQRDDYLASGSIRRSPKVGRNEPCPCGSGKKFKKCCGQEPTLH